MKKIAFGCVFLLGSVLWAAKPPKSTPELLKKGESSFKANCVACHGPTGAGDGEVGKMLKPPPRNFSKDKFKQGDSVSAIFKTIAGGVKNTGMAGYPHLTEEERWGLAYYVLQLKNKH